MKDPKYFFFINNQELKNLLATTPSNAGDKELSIWNTLGPLSAEMILNNSNLDDLAIDTNDLEFKKVDHNSDGSC